VFQYRGASLIPTFHPAYLLRSPSQKKECWADIQLAMAELGLARPAREADVKRAAGDAPHGAPHGAPGDAPA
jgi:DNA polymerase